MPKPNDDSSNTTNDQTNDRTSTSDPSLRVSASELETSAAGLGLDRAIASPTLVASVHPPKHGLPESDLAPPARAPRPSGSSPSRGPRPAGKRGRKRRLEATTPNRAGRRFNSRHRG